MASGSWRLSKVSTPYKEHSVHGGPGMRWSYDHTIGMRAGFGACLLRLSSTIHLTSELAQLQLRVTGRPTPPSLGLKLLLCKTSPLHTLIALANKLPNSVDIFGGGCCWRTAPSWRTRSFYLSDTFYRSEDARFWLVAFLRCPSSSCLVCTTPGLPGVPNLRSSFLHCLFKSEWTQWKAEL